MYSLVVVVAVVAYLMMAYLIDEIKVSVDETTCKSLMYGGGG